MNATNHIPNGNPKLILLASFFCVSIIIIIIIICIWFAL